MTANDELNFIDSFTTFVVERNIIALQNLLIDSKFKDQILIDGMDFLSAICDNIEENMIDFNNRDDIYCNMINFIAQNGNPKEVICIFNVHLHKAKEDFKFLILLYPLSVALQRLDKSSLHTIAIIKDALESAISYFNNLPVAHYKGLEGEELEVYIQTSETQRFLRLSRTYLGFIESMMNNKEFMEFCEIRSEILQNLLMLFNCSLIKLAFYSPGIVAEECRACSSRAFGLIEKLVACFHGFLITITTTRDDKNNLISNCSILSVLYHIFVGQCFGKYPQIYLPTYNFNICVPALSTCLQTSSDPHIIRVALQLMDVFDRRIDLLKISWKPSMHLGFFTALKVAMTSNFNQEIRASTYNIFVRLFDKFDNKGRYKLLRGLLKDADHFGYKGQLIMLLKREIISAVTRAGPSDRYFTGSSVYSLISDIYSLPDGDQTDIVSESEWLLAALNLLYVVTRRDKRQLVGLDVLMDDFEKDFLRPLTKATDLSMGHYINEKRLVERGEQASTMSDMGFMDEKQKLDFIERAILMIELIRCNISRITNIV